MIILRQREFGIKTLLSGAKHSGLKRSLKREIGRHNVQKAKKLRESNGRYFNKLAEENAKVNRSKSLGNSEIEKKLSDEAEKYGAKVFPTKELGNSVMDVNTILERQPLLGSTEKIRERAKWLGEDPSHDALELAKAIESGKYKKILFRNQANGGGLGTLSHEVGHLRRDNMALPKNVKEREALVSELQSANITKENTRDKKIAKKRKAMRRDLVNEEWAATEEGLKAMEEYGASRKELRSAKKQMKEALKTYKIGKKLGDRLDKMSALLPRRNGQRNLAKLSDDPWEKAILKNQ